MLNLYFALIEQRPEWATRHEKLILQHENAPSHAAKAVRDLPDLAISTTTCFYRCLTDFPPNTLTIIRRFE